MRNCDWTEKVSLLIDGELAAAETNAVETHLGGCLACRAAREDFLLLRRRISSVQPEMNPLAQREALRNILAAARPEASADFATAAPKTERRARFSGLFALPQFGPGLAAASVVLLVCVVAGLLLLRGERRPDQVAGKQQAATPQSSTRAAENGNVPSAAQHGASPDVPAGEREATAAPAPTVELAKFQPKGVGGVKSDKIRPQGVLPGDRGKIKPKGVGTELAKLPREVIDVPFVIPPRVEVEALEFNEAEVAANDVDGPAAPAPSALSTARHAEQAQMLLRSFRNASATEAADLSYERERSQELLYRNIVLRREAARGGKANVEATLGQLETILLDIANLPEKPASEDVRSIKNRMERKNIVAMLQVAARD
jgi:anti-sigma factor RsiW